MGELADRYRRCMRRVGSVPVSATTRAEWEQERDAIAVAIGLLELRAQTLADWRAEPSVALVEADDKIVSLRQQLAAAERRAEAAERQNVIVLDALRQGHRIWKLLPMDLGPGATATHINEVRGGDHDWVFSFRCGGICNKRRVVVAIYDLPIVVPDDSLLERRATELIEAGEQLLAQYRAEQAKAEAAADAKANEAFRAPPPGPDGDAVTMTFKVQP